MSSSASDKNRIVVYIGTHKIAALLVSIEGLEPSVKSFQVQTLPEGFEKGVVSNLQKASASIDVLIKGLFDRGQARPEHLSCYVILGNSKLKMYSYSSSIYYQGSPRSLGSEDMRQVIRQTRSVATLPLTEIVLQAIPDTYLVNDLGGVKNPAGLEANRLGVNLKIYTMNFQDFKNLSKVFETSDIDAEAFFPKPVAVSDAVLTETEKQEGALVIDLVDDGTNLALWKSGELIQTRVVDCGGMSLSGSLAQQWGIEVNDARKIKEKFGSLETALDFGGELIPIVDRSSDGRQQVRRQEFQEKFLEMGKKWLGSILEEADQFAKDNKVLHPHYIYTGGGAHLQGYLEFLQKHFNRTGRLGLARQIDAPQELLVDPSMTAPLGMAKWLAVYEREQKQFFAPRGFFQKTVATAKDWFSAYF